MQTNNGVTDNNAFFLTALMTCILRFLPNEACMHCPSLQVETTWTTHRGTHCTYLPEQGITDRVGTLVFAVRKYQF